MVKVNPSYSSSGHNVTRFGEKAAESFGKLIAEAMEIKGHPMKDALFKECGIASNKKGVTLKESLGEKFIEAYSQGTFKEDLTTSNTTGAYTKLLYRTIITAAYAQLQDVLDAVIVFDDLKNSGGGFGSLQIPIGQPTVAYEVAEGQVVNKFDEGVTEVDVKPRPVACGTSITWRTQKRALPSILQWLMNNASNAIYRKIASDIVAGIVATAGDSVTGYDAANAAYNSIIDARKKVNGAKDSKGIPYGFVATHVFLSYDAEATLKKSQDWKSHVQYAVIAPGEPNAVDRQIEWFSRMKMVVTPFIPTGNVRGFVIDKNYAVAYVPESDVESFEGQIPGRPYDKEVVLIMSTGQATLYPKAICNLEA
jgi:hypothetical protein